MDSQLALLMDPTKKILPQDQSNWVTVKGKAVNPGYDPQLHRWTDGFFFSASYTSQYALLVPGRVIVLNK
jgi:hypothetical protein